MFPFSFLIAGLAAFTAIVLGIEVSKQSLITHSRDQQGNTNHNTLVQSGGKRDDIICGNYPTADKGNVMEIEWDLRTRETDEFTIKGKGCKRLICWNTSAIYVSFTLSARPADIPRHKLTDGYTSCRSAAPAMRTKPGS